MIIQQKSATGSDGYYPRLLITAPYGSEVTVNGIVITGIIGETTDTYTYVCNDYGTYTVVGTLSGKSKTVIVSVDNVKDYSVAITYALYLYNQGDECTSITGGWTGYRYSSSYGSFSKNSNNIVLNSATSSSYNVSMITTNKISFSNYSYICAEYSLTNIHGAIRIPDEKTYDPTPWTYQLDLSTGTNLTAKKTLVASELSGTHYACMTVWGNNSAATTMTIYKIWLE